MFPEFQEFKKIPRLSRNITITEKIDGTNGVIYIDEVGIIYAGSRNRWLWCSQQDKVCNDNYGFASWVREHQEELKQLGIGFHYGEWWGQGIQRNYGLKEKRFSLFNTTRWCLYNESPKLISINPKTKEEKYQDKAPQGCHIVPVLYEGIFSEEMIGNCLMTLGEFGSKAVPGFMKPEGIVIYHQAAKQYFKKTIEHDEIGKEQIGG